MDAEVEALDIREPDVTEEAVGEDGPQVDLDEAHLDFLLFQTPLTSEAPDFPLLQRDRLQSHLG